MYKQCTVLLRKKVHLKEISSQVLSRKSVFKEALPEIR
jgi:hypothetical protein